MAPKRNPVLEAITDPTKNFLATFLIGTVLFSLISDGLSALFWGNFSIWLQSQLSITNKNQFQGYMLIVLIILVLVLIYSTNVAQWMRSLFAQWGILGTETPDQTSTRPIDHPSKGLIVIMSPKPDSPAEAAIRYHWNQGQAPNLEHCWIICTDTSLPFARPMKQALLADGLDEHQTHLYYGSYELNDPNQSGLSLTLSDQTTDDPDTILNLINAIFADAQFKGLSESDIIIDFTGGTKPMSIGTVLACVSPSRRLEYFTQTNPPGLVEVQVSYKIKPIR